MPFNTLVQQLWTSTIQHQLVVIAMFVQITWEDLAAAEQAVGTFGGDNRAGVQGTLHRISAIRNRKGTIVGLTCRVGRAVTGHIDMIRDMLEGGSICSGVLCTTIHMTMSLQRFAVTAASSAAVCGDSGYQPSTFKFSTSLHCAKFLPARAVEHTAVSSWHIPCVQSYLA